MDYDGRGSWLPWLLRWDRVLLFRSALLYVVCSAVYVLLLVVAGYCCWDRVLVLRSALLCCVVLCCLCSDVGGFWLLLLGSRSDVAFCSDG
jgi:hypothetical protein